MLPTLRTTGVNNVSINFIFLILLYNVYISTGLHECYYKDGQVSTVSNPGKYVLLITDKSQKKIHQPPLHVSGISNRHFVGCIQPVNIICIVYTSVSQPVGRGPLVGYGLFLVGRQTFLNLFRIKNLTIISNKYIGKQPNKFISTQLKVKKRL